MYIAATSNAWQEYYKMRSARLAHGDECAWLIFDKNSSEYDGSELDTMSTDQKIDGETFDDIKLQLEGMYGLGRVYLASDYRKEGMYWGCKSYRGKFCIAQRQILDVPEDTVKDELFVQQLINTVMASPDGIVIRSVSDTGVTEYDAQLTAHLAALVRDYKIRVSKGVMRYNPKAKSTGSCREGKVLTPEEQIIFDAENNFDSMDWHKFNSEVDKQLEINVRKQIKNAQVRLRVNADLDNLYFSTATSSGWFHDTKQLIINLETLKRSSLFKTKAAADIKSLERQLKPYIKSMVHTAWKVWATGGRCRNYEAKRRDPEYKRVLHETFPKLLTYMPSLKKDFDESWVKYKKKYDDKPVRVKKEVSNVDKQDATV